MTRPIDEILNLMDELSVWSDSEIVDQAYSATQHAMSRLEVEDQFSVSIYLSPTVRSCSLSQLIGWIYGIGQF